MADEDVHAPPHTFGVRNPGPRQMPPRNSSPIEYFFLLFTAATFKMLLNNTKAYGKEYLRGMQAWIQRHPRSRFRRWNVDDMNITMLKKYIGLCINMGLVRKKNVKDYWAQKYPSQYVPFFASVMPLHKFSMFSRLLHVGVTNAPVQGQPGFDPWNKVRPVLDALNAKFKVHSFHLNMFQSTRAWSA